MASEAVLNFLDEHNRPYSVSDIQNSLKTLSKGAVQKALDSLVTAGQVREKVYGKQKVYFIAQNTEMTSKEASEQVLALDRQINEVNSNLGEAKGKLKAHEARSGSIQGKLTIPEALDKKMALETKVRGLKDSLKRFQGVDPIAPEVKKTVQANYDKYLGTYRKRKRLCLDILDAILENYPKTKKQLYEDVGIETDEDAGFVV